MAKSPLNKLTLVFVLLFIIIATVGCTMWGRSESDTEVAQSGASEPLAQPGTEEGKGLDPTLMENMPEPAAAELETSESQTVVTPLELCDLDTDGDCDRDDYELFDGAIHTCFDDPPSVEQGLGRKHHPLADLNQDGWVGLHDYDVLYPLFPTKVVEAYFER